MGPLCKKTGDLANWDMGTSEVLNDNFALVFSYTISSHMNYGR